MHKRERGSEQEVSEICSRNIKSSGIVIVGDNLWIIQVSAFGF